MNKPVVAKIFVKKALVAEAIVAKIFAEKKLVAVEFVMEAFVELKFVEVELVIVEFVVNTPAKEIVLAKKFVAVAFVNVAFVAKIFPIFAEVIVELAAVVVENVVVPSMFIIPLAEIRILSVGVVVPLGVVMKTNLPGILFSAGVPSTEPRIIAPSRYAEPSYPEKVVSPKFPVFEIIVGAAFVPCDAAITYAPQPPPATRCKTSLLLPVSSANSRRTVESPAKAPGVFVPKPTRLLVES